MLSVSTELKESLQRLNNTLHNLYPFEQLSKLELRERLQEYGQFLTLSKLSTTDVACWFEGGQLVGIDGSTNSIQGKGVRRIQLFQALAKSTTGQEEWLADLETSLVPRAEDFRTSVSLMPLLELTLARRVLELWSPKLLLMDGSLLYFFQEDEPQCEELRELFLAADGSIVGVGEEMATDALARKVCPEGTMFTDADLLCGLLDEGEAFLWGEDFYKSYGLWRAAARFTSSPEPVVVDGFLGEEVPELLSIIYALTPKDGRGIPLWLDIVDQKVRITNVVAEGLIDSLIDVGLRRRLLMTKRSERII
jgi:hypothetical protein